MALVSNIVIALLISFLFWGERNISHKRMTVSSPSSNGEVDSSHCEGRGRGRKQAGNHAEPEGSKASVQEKLITKTLYKNLFATGSKKGPKK